MKLLTLAILLVFTDPLLSQSMDEIQLEEQTSMDASFDNDYKGIGLGLEIMPTPYNQSLGLGLFWRISSNWSAKLNGASYGGQFDFSKGYIVAEARYFLLWGFYTDFGLGTWTARKGFAEKDDIGFRNYGALLELGWSAFEDDHWSLGLSLVALSYSFNGEDKAYLYVNGFELVYYFL